MRGTTVSNSTSAKCHMLSIERVLLFVRESVKIDKPLSDGVMNIGLR